MTTPRFNQLVTMLGGLSDVELQAAERCIALYRRERSLTHIAAFRIGDLVEFPSKAFGRVAGRVERVDIGTVRVRSPRHQDVVFTVPAHLVERAS